MMQLFTAQCSSHKSSTINNEDKHVIIYYLQDGKLEKERQNLCYESSF